MAGQAAACEDIHRLFCGAGRIFVFTAIDLSSCIASLETKGNLETSTSCAGSGFAVVWLSFVSVLMDSGSHGS